MTPEVTYNDLPEAFEGAQKRRTEFKSPEEKLSYDADGLIALAQKIYGRVIVTVREVVDLSTRKEDDVTALRRAVAIKLKNPEKVEIDARLIPCGQEDAANKYGFTIGENPKSQDAKIVESPVNSLQERELSPEDAERTLRALEKRFKASYLHQGCDWVKVKSALEANPKALWSVNQMETKGHEPDVYHFDDSGFDIGTCSEETPVDARNCVYDAEAANYMKKDYPDINFNGSAVEMAKAMGISLMTPEQYEKILQSKDTFDRNTWSWLLTDESTRKSGLALYGGRRHSIFAVHVYQDYVDNRGLYRAWRGSLRVSWAA